MEVYIKTMRRNQCFIKSLPYIKIIAILFLFAICFQFIEKNIYIIAQNNEHAIYNKILEEFRANPDDFVIKDKYIIKEYNSIYNNFVTYNTLIKEDVVCFPVEKSYINLIYFDDSWYSSRDYGGERKHEGTDIMYEDNIRGEVPIVSVCDGT